MRYALSILFISFQYLYKKDAATSLANSRLPAIIITEKKAPLNNLDNPKTEKNAALPATNSADIPIKVLKFFTRSNIIFPYQVLTFVVFVF